MGPVHAGTGPTAAVGLAANPNLGVSIISSEAPAARVIWSARLVLRLWPALRYAQGHGASTDASRHRLVTFPLTALPYGPAGENLTPGPCTPRPFYRRKSPHQKGGEC